MVIVTILKIKLVGGGEGRKEGKKLHHHRTDDAYHTYIGFPSLPAAKDGFKNSGLTLYAVT